MSSVSWIRRHTPEHAPVLWRLEWALDGLATGVSWPVRMARRLARHLRYRFWVYHNITTSEDLSIGRHCQLLTNDGAYIEIGPRVSIADHVVLNACLDGGIRIGADCLIGPRVYLRTSDHRFAWTDRPIRAQGHERGTIVIEEDCWLGAGVIVMKNVRIGAHSVVGAGSVVTHNLPAWSVAAGNPCRVIRSRQP